MLFHIHWLCVSVSQSCLTLNDPMDCSPPGSSFHGDSPGKNTGVGCSNWTQVSCISGGLFTVGATREATPNPSPRQPQIHFLLLSIYLFWIFHIDGIVQYVVLCTSLLSLNLIFKIYPQCNIYQYFNYGWVLLHCMDMPHFVYLPNDQLMGNWVVSIFWLLNIVLLWTFMYHIIYQYMSSFLSGV